MYLGPKTQLYANDIASHQHGANFFKTVLDHGSGFPELPHRWGGKSPWAGKVQLNDKAASDLEPEDQLGAVVARESTRCVSPSQCRPFFLVVGLCKAPPEFDAY